MNEPSSPLTTSAPSAGEHLEFNKMAPPEPGSVWQHKKGTFYTVLAITTRPEDEKADEFPVTVLYMGEDGRQWSRTLKRWFGSMTQVAPAPYKPGTLLSLVYLAVHQWRVRRKALKQNN